MKWKADLETIDSPTVFVDTDGTLMYWSMS
jgi:hypothetical protein